MPTLQTYIDSTRRLLRDNGTLYPNTDIIAFINEARHQRDLDTRLVRKVVGKSTVANQPTYSLNTISTTGTFIRGEAALLNAREIASVYVIPVGGVAGGVGIRYPLSRRAYSYVAYITSLSWPNYPTIYALGPGPDAVTIAPPPAQIYAVEWDLVGTYPDLTMVTDPEPMPDPYNDPLPYLAAAIAKHNAQRFDEAMMFEKTYETRLRRITVGIHSYSLGDAGADLPNSRR